MSIFVTVANGAFGISFTAVTYGRRKYSHKADFNLLRKGNIKVNIKKLLSQLNTPSNCLRSYWKKRIQNGPGVRIPYTQSEMLSANRKRTTIPVSRNDLSMEIPKTMFNDSDQRCVFSIRYPVQIFFVFQAKSWIFFYLKYNFIKSELSQELTPEISWLSPDFSWPNAIIFFLRFARRAPIFFENNTSVSIYRRVVSITTKGQFLMYLGRNIKIYWLRASPQLFLTFLTVHFFYWLFFCCFMEVSRIPGTPGLYDFSRLSWPVLSL